MKDDAMPKDSEISTGCGPLIAPSAGRQRSLRLQIFERIRAAGHISRAQIAKELYASPATVTTLTAALIQDGLVQEVSIERGSADAGRGRPPVGLAIRPDALRVIGIKLSDQVHTAVLSDFGGNRLASASTPAITAATMPEVLETTERMIDDVCAQAGVVRSDLAGVGIGMPGFVESDSGRVLWSPLLAQRNVNVAKLATQHLGVDVFVDNDANLAALNELWFGAGRALSSFAVVTIEHGVGMGLVVDHQLYRGANGLGMELGHTKVQLDGALCRCGQRGCLEAYVADYALKREARTALNLDGARDAQTCDELRDLYAQAQAGHAAALSIFERAGRYMALGLANVMNLFDPSLIILSGGRMQYDYLYADKVMQELERLTLTEGRGVPRIEVNEWGDLLWATGAAALVLSAVTERRLDDARSETLS